MSFFYLIVFQHDKKKEMRIDLCKNNPVFPGFFVFKPLLLKSRGRGVLKLRLSFMHLDLPVFSSLVHFQVLWISGALDFKCFGLWNKKRQYTL